MNSTTTPRRGFTIVEVVIIITVLGILTTIGVFGWGAMNKWSQNKQRGEEISQWKGAFTLYKTRYGVYPEPAGSLPFSVCLGKSFTNGKCGNDGSINESGNLMTEIAKVTRIPEFTHPPVASLYVGPYVNYSTTDITLFTLVQGNASDCPSDTTFESSPASDVALCKMTLTR